MANSVTRTLVRMCEDAESEDCVLIKIIKLLC